MKLFSNKKDIEIERLKNSNKMKDREIRELRFLCDKKDKYFKEMISDGLRHGSKLAAMHMSDRKEYLKETKRRKK